MFKCGNLIKEAFLTFSLRYLKQYLDISFTSNVLNLATIMLQVYLNLSKKTPAN